MKLYNRILCLLCLVAVVVASFGCTKGATEETTALKETSKAEETTVAPVPETVTYTVPSRHEKDGRVQYEYTYAEDGLSLSKTDYTEETPITYTVTFDDAGNPLKTEWTVVINDARTELWRDDYYLDESGRIVDEKRYCEGQIQNAYTYTYNDDGSIDTQETRNVKQQNIIYKYLYDDMGTHTGTRFKKYNGEAGYYMEEKACTYDDGGRLLTETSSSYSTVHEYTLKEGLVTQEKITNIAGEYSWNYYYQFTYEDSKLTKRDCSFEGVLTDTEYFEETEFEHYKKAIDWIFRERLP